MKIGDPKLNNLMVNVQTLSREIGLPFVNVSMNFVSFFKFLNKIGLIKMEKCTNEVFDYCQDIIKQHEFKGMGVIVTVDYIFLMSVFGPMKCLKNTFYEASVSTLHCRYNSHV